MSVTSTSRKPGLNIPSQPPSLESIYRLVKDDFSAVNRLIPTRLTSDVDLVEEIGRYILESGGKRLRPMLVLLSSKALGYTGSHHISLAAIIEFLHTATLLHDDVVDHSMLRRGKTTANAAWGNAPSVLVGDFLYSRAFQLMVELGSMPIMGVLSNATNAIAEGEVMQLANVGNADIDENQYREVIRCKTALLFEAATHTGALLAYGERSTSNDAQLEAMRMFGLHFGTAYQLIDDWLDYMGDTATMGKNPGDDLAEGKLTLPVIQALRMGSNSQQKIIREAIAQRSSDHLPTIRQIVNETGALSYTKDAAASAGETAIAYLQRLTPNAYSEAMADLTEYSLSRLG